MPRRSQGARLYLDPERKHWVIRDGTSFMRTGCAESDHANAEKQLSEYIAGKYRPAPSASPLIADVLLVYAKEHLPSTRAAAKAAHNISNLSPFWANKTVADVTGPNCKEYAKDRPPVAARRDLEVLRASIYYWHEHYGPLARMPAIVLPNKPAPRERWLTRDEARRLRHAAKDTPHLYRFIVLALKTGSRSGVLLRLEWSWIDLERGLMNRRAPGEAEVGTKRTPPVRLGRAVLRLLRHWKEQDGKVKHVVHYNGLPVQKLRRSFETACKAAGLEGVSPHTLRHTRATWLMQKKIDLWQASGHLGMSVRTLETTYGKHSPDYQKDASDV
jgi:integrase